MRGNLRGVKVAFVIASLLFALTIIYMHAAGNKLEEDRHERFTATGGKSVPLTFIGGAFRSGTTLMRTMLDVHPDIRCGPETTAIPQTLAAVLLEYANDGLSEDAGYFERGADEWMSVIDNAMRNYILDIILSNGAPSKYYCNKDPLNLLYIKYLENIFPKSKFILMIRDLRAVSYSYLESKLADSTTYRYERTAKDVHKPLYLDGLTKWVGKIPNDVLKDLPQLAPMMIHLGYDVTSKIPYYGEPDAFVLKKVISHSEDKPRPIVPKIKLIPNPNDLPGKPPDID